jgi:hypothetical protein
MDGFFNARCMVVAGVSNVPGNLAIRELIVLNAEYQKPPALCLFADGPELYQDKEMITFPLFDDPAEAVRALARNRDRILLRPLPFSAERPGRVDLRSEGAGEPNGRIGAFGVLEGGLHEDPPA